jgi:hypothetical protein
LPFLGAYLSPLNSSISRVSPVFFSSALVVGLRDGIDMHALNDIRSFLTRPLPGIIIF